MHKLIAVLISSALVSSSLLAAENPIFDQLIGCGITFPDGSVVKLPAPSMPDDADQQTRDRILAKVADRHPLKQFLLDSRVAPFVLKIESIKDEKGNRTGQSVDLWFVAYGDLKKIDEHRLFDELGLLQPPQDRGQEADAELSESRDLAADDLKSRGIAVREKTAEFEEHYGAFDGTLLNRVQISGVMHTAVTSGGKSIQVAAVLDSRFAEDSAFPNRWRSRSKDKLGKTVEGPAQLYQGFGGYAKFTPLDVPARAILIECHVVFHEPHGWFDGMNLLRSKLPVAIQNNVREFRTKLSRLDK
ncbi:MAG: hypothetical protein FJ276_06205 [Planctomycetes bacterium]|nr:hypothetical protein [Planctomycetota bacterium]